MKKQKGLRRQFLILNGSPVLGFIKRKNKFTSCDTYKDVTDSVDCKVCHYTSHTSDINYHTSHTSDIDYQTSHSCDIIHHTSHSSDINL